MTRRSMRRAAAGAAVLAAGVLAAGVLACVTSTAAPAQAYCPSGNEWPGSLLYAGIGGAVPDGWHPAIKASMKEWNNVSGANWTIQYRAGSDVHFLVKYNTPSGGFNGQPAITRLEVNASGQIVGGNVFLNPGWNWNLNGNLNANTYLADVRTVTTHELGHEIRLRHPFDCHAMSTAEKQSAMNPNGVQKWAINSDDKAGLAHMK